MGCQDGEMQISETERPFTGGGWCGNSIKPTHYFSESSSVKVTIKLHKLPDDNDDYNYDIKIIYRMWPKKESAIRYGGQNYGKYIQVQDCSCFSFFLTLLFFEFTVTYMQF